MLIKVIIPSTNREAGLAKWGVALDENAFWVTIINQFRIKTIQIHFNLIYGWWDSADVQDAIDLTPIKIWYTNWSNKASKNQFFHSFPCIFNFDMFEIECTWVQKVEIDTTL